MLGTSTTSGNVIQEGKTCVIFKCMSLRDIFLDGVSYQQKCWARAKIIIFPRLTLLLPKSYHTIAPTFHSKVLKLVNFV